MGVLHFLPANPLITSPHTLHLGMTQLLHGCCIQQLQSLLKDSIHTVKRRGESSEIVQVKKDNIATLLQWGRNILPSSCTLIRSVTSPRRRSQIAWREWPHQRLPDATVLPSLRQRPW